MDCCMNIKMRRPGGGGGGGGFDSWWERCKKWASFPSQGAVNGGAVSKWPCCRWDVKHNQPTNQPTNQIWKTNAGYSLNNTQMDIWHYICFSWNLHWDFTILRFDIEISCHFYTTDWWKNWDFRHTCSLKVMGDLIKYNDGYLKTIDE